MPKAERPWREHGHHPGCGRHGLFHVPACLRSRARPYGWSAHISIGISSTVLRATGRHPKLNVKLPDGIRAFHHEEFARALGTDTDLIVLGVSSAGIGWAIDRLCDALTQSRASGDDHQGHASGSGWPDGASRSCRPRGEAAQGIRSDGRRHRRALHRGRACGAAPHRHGHHLARRRLRPLALCHAGNRLLSSAPLG